MGLVKNIVLSVIAVVVLFVALGSFFVVQAGERGVVFSAFSGIKQHSYEEGFHMKAPFFDDVTGVEVRTKKVEIDLASTSFDQQNVGVQIAVNYRVQGDEAHLLYQEVGNEYEARIINPAIAGAVKSAMAEYKAEELIQQRLTVSDKIEENLRSQLAGRHLIIDSVNIVNIQFSTDYQAAIERKTTAVQNLETEKNNLEIKKVQAEQLVAEAKGRADSRKVEADGNAYSILAVATAEAEGIRLRNDALENSEGVIELTKAEKWNGQLPSTVLGDTVPMMSIK